MDLRLLTNNIQPMRYKNKMHGIVPNTVYRIFPASESSPHMVKLSSAGIVHTTEVIVAVG